MRAIAIAVMLGLHGIEMAIRGKPWELSGFEAVFVFAFLLCLIFGW